MAADDFKLRLREVKAALEISDSALAEVAGISRQSINGYLNSDREPSRDTLASWIKTYGINAQWLLTGEGPMFTGPADTPQLADPLSIKVDQVARAMRSSGAGEEAVLLAVRAMIDGELDRVRGRYSVRESASPPLAAEGAEGYQDPKKAAGGDSA